MPLVLLVSLVPQMPLVLWIRLVSLHVTVCGMSAGIGALLNERAASMICRKGGMEPNFNLTGRVCMYLAPGWGVV